jgi:pimeloyl-ACP methyl ester carboxylesterase
MLRGTARALRFGWEWKTGTADIREVEVDVQRSDRTVPATLFLPSRFSPPLPGWVTLPGVTRPGRKHPTLVRFVRSLAASGSAVLVPEIPEWRELLLAPERAYDTLRSAIPTLAEQDGIAPGRIGAMGFSFAGPPVLVAGKDSDLTRHLKVVVSFGGYCSMEPTLRFLFSGEHEWKGNRFMIEPDPYGRWIVGGNYIPRAEGHEEAEDVRKALMELAKAAGDLQLPSWEAHHEVRKDDLEANLPPARRDLFRAFAPPVGVPVPPAKVAEVVPVLTRAVREVSPLFEIAPLLADGLEVPARLIHGRQDRLLPFTETLRLAESFPPGSEVKVFLTGLFSHSRRDVRGSRAKELVEQIRFVGMMSNVLGML